MDEYTPTTEQVSDGYSGYWHATSVVGKNARAEFDRWLAEHDRVVAANAWERCDAAINEHVSRDGTSTEGWPTNPYRITEENN